MCQNDQINCKTQTKHHANTTVHHQIICTESFFNTGRQRSLFLKISCSGLRLLFKFFLPHFVKVHIYWEGNKILRNLHRRFDCYYSRVRNKCTPMLIKFLTIFQRLLPYSGLHRAYTLDSGVYNKTNLRWRFLKNLWPSQNIWTLNVKRIFL